ncbi:tyrosine-protein phosphatase [Blastococcus goldschmidtiae]|uniref:Tyrosine-protein phosphatase n=1 Tax=Blastococcus goldschmidtiae TaxID=3075546 RepID=A0ABU2K7W2_9ACTN|nr:tyrosine-protein phosphatase [Blastococcus sp. DSM 46792]MDT0276258.1 tyrosine-protein phosphatase [Blastococcus sp. DSM 46792]
MSLIDDAPRFPLSAPVNLRHLGGVEIPGGTIRDDFVIRADDLSLADEDSATRLVQSGVATVIDLRSAAEVGATGRGPLGRMPVAYHHLPFLGSIGSAGLPAASDVFDQSRFEAMYIRMYEEAAPRIVTALAVIATAPGTTAFHCAAGQDRTGVLAASLLLALGAEHEAIVEDYARTAVNSQAVMDRIAPVMTSFLAELGIDLDQAARAAMRTEFSPAPMQGLLRHLSSTYADPLAPLRAAGLTDGLVAMLRERALAA